jgi:hypothetical protein
MGFPTMNALSVARWIQRATVSSATGIVEGIASGQHNLFSVPGVVDVSGMEFSVGIAADALSGTPGKGADATDASLTAVSFSDGGPSGDATTVAELYAATAMTSSVAWAARVPKDSNGTSVTDFDADDWVNLYQKTIPASVAGIAAYDLEASYIYGKPGAIN